MFLNTFLLGHHEARDLVVIHDFLFVYVSKIIYKCPTIIPLFSAFRLHIRCTRET